MLAIPIQRSLTQLSNQDALEVTRITPLMTKICAILLNENHKGLGFSIKGEWVENPPGHYL